LGDASHTECIKLLIQLIRFDYFLFISTKEEILVFILWQQFGNMWK